MRYSKVLGKTLRETPRGAETRAQELLLRAGFIRSSAAGVMLLPLGWRVMQKMRALFASELSAAGALECAPLALAVPPGRDRGGATGTEMARALAACRPAIRDQYPFAAVHEQALAVLSGSLAFSYRDLPASVSALQTASRPDSRAGDVRFAAQFPLYSGYRFEGGDEELSAGVGALERACAAAASKAGIQTVAMERPAHWAVGGRDIAVLSETGNETAVQCENCGYTASIDAAQSVAPPFDQSEEPAAMEAVLGEGIIGTAELCEFLGIPRQKTTKTLLLQADDRVVAACVRGEYDVSEAKLAALVGCSKLELAAPFVVRELTGADIGYAGPLGLPGGVEVFWDRSTADRVNFEAGANRTDYHYINVNFERDLPYPERFVDIRVAREGEKCKACGQGTLVFRKATSIGHVSAPGGLYSKQLKATVTARDGKTQALLVACCAVDLLRLMALCVERHSDDKGIAWPAAAAPFTVHLVSLPGGESRAGELYDRLERARIDVLWDDRAEPAGVKFRDAELIGVPWRFVVSGRTGEKVECRARSAGESELLPMEQALARAAGN